MNKKSVTEDQMLVIIEFMERYGDIAQAIKTAEGKVRRKLLWEELTSALSVMGGGASKSTEKWMKANNNVEREVEIGNENISPANLNVDVVEATNNTQCAIPLAGSQRKRRRRKTDDQLEDSPEDHHVFTPQTGNRRRRHENSQTSITLTSLHELERKRLELEERKLASQIEFQTQILDFLDEIKTSPDEFFK